MFNEQLDENIVQQDTNHHQHQVPNELYPSAQVRTCENNISHQEKSQWKSDAKRDDKGSNMRANSNKRQMYNTLVENKIVTDKINKYIQHCITTTAGEITESLDIHDLLERRIKEVNDRSNCFFHVNWARN